MAAVPARWALELTAEEVALVREALEYFDRALVLKLTSLQAIRNGEPIEEGFAAIADTRRDSKPIGIGEEDLLAVIHLNQAKGRALRPLLARIGDQP